MRLGNVAYNVTNKNNQIKTSEIQKVGTHPVVSQGQSLIDGYSNNDDKVFRINTSLTMFGDHTRNVKYIDFDFVVGADGTKFLCPITIDSKFFYYVILNAAINMNSRGYERHFAILRAIYHPLPPLAEQHRIVEKLEAVLPKVSQYDQVETLLTKFQESFPESLKKSILQSAIQGKLVPQDPNDEPASVLLERIQKEKQKLVKAGKIKREKVESFIFRDSDNRHYEKIGNQTRCIEDEIPFEIPENWQWVRLFNITQYIQRGKSPKYSPIRKYPVLAQKCNQWDGISLEKALFIESDSISKYSEERFLQEDDIVVNSTGTGTMGRVGIFKTEILGHYERIVADSHITVIRGVTLSMKYVYRLLCTAFYQKWLEDNADGSTNQKELYIDTFKSLLIPLPPLAEQHRIVAEVERLLEVCRRL